MAKKLLLTAAVVGCLAVPGAARADVSVHVGFGPPPVIVAPPPLVVVPGLPVYYAPGVQLNLFVYGGRYYSFHNGWWYYAARPGAPWTIVAQRRVPRAVLAVPYGYYAVPPGPYYAAPPGHVPPGLARKAWYRACPPGLAKKGRC
jgi:hypothetical protein